jgi:hypothetical protein
MLERAREVAFVAAIARCEDDSCDALVDVEVVEEAWVLVEKDVGRMSSEVECAAMVVRKVSYDGLWIALTFGMWR